MVNFPLSESNLIISIISKLSIIKTYNAPSPKAPAGFLTPSHAYGHGTFMTVLDDLTAMNPAKIKQVCVWLGICDKTMHRYISEASPIPHAICYAMFFESKWGRDSMDCEVINNRKMLAMEISVLNSKCRALESENKRLTKQILTTSHAANAPTYAPSERVIGTGKDIHTRAVVRPEESPAHPFHQFKIGLCRHKR